VESSASSSGASSADPYAAAWERVSVAILTTPGALREDVRHAIVQGADPAELAALLDKVRRHAYRIVDGDIAGLDADVVLEAVLAAALAEGDERRRAALEAIG
jgi:hypothetical protein